MRRLLGLLISVGLAALGFGLFATHALAVDPSLSVSDVNQDVNERVTVHFTGADFGTPGLGAWTIDIGYDPTLLVAISCATDAGLSVCNSNYDDDTVRMAGATAEGLTGNFEISSIVFECRDRAGESPLTILPRDVYDATPVNLQPIDAALNHGSVTCGSTVQHLPDAGGRGPIDGKLSLALAGLFAIVAVIAVSRATPYLHRRVR